GTAGVVRLDGGEVGQRLLRGRLDELARLGRRLHPRAETAEPLLHLDGRQPVAEQLARLAADGAVAGDEDDRDAPVAAHGGVDPGLADERPVEAEALPRLARDGVGEDAVGRAGHRVHADEEAGVAARLEEARVLRPLLLHDVLARRVEELRDERVEAPRPAGAVVVHDDDLRRAGRLRAAHRRVDLLGVEDAALLVELLAAGALLPLDDAGDALHVADDVDAHERDDNVGPWRRASEGRAFSSPAAPAGSAPPASAPSRRRARGSSSTTTRAASGPRSSRRRSAASRSRPTSPTRRRSTSCSPPPATSRSAPRWPASGRGRTSPSGSCRSTAGRRRCGRTSPRRSSPRAPFSAWSSAPAAATSSSSARPPAASARRVTPTTPPRSPPSRSASSSASRTRSSGSRRAAASTPSRPAGRTRR